MGIVAVGCVGGVSNAGGVGMVVGHGDRGVG